MSEWQPIETAPKDGTRVLVYIPECEDTQAPWMGEAYWDAEYPCVDYRGWFDQATYFPGLEGEPTHWMPRPKSPAGYP